MTITRWGGALRHRIPDIWPHWGAAFEGNTAVADATGEAIAIIGRFAHKSGVAQDVNKIWLRPGTIVSTGGSTARLSVEGASAATAGLVPDGVEAAYVEFLLSALVINVPYQTAALSANVNLTPGELVAVRLAFNAGGRLGADTFTYRGIAEMIGTQSSAVHHYNGSAWVYQTIIPNIWFECTDGSFGTVKGSLVYKTLGTISFNQGTAGADEYGNKIILPAPIEAAGLWCLVNPQAATGDFSMVLSDSAGTDPPIDSIAIDASQLTYAASLRRLDVPFAAGPRVLPAGTYHVTLQPTQSAQSINTNYFDMHAAAHLQMHDSFGTSVTGVARLNLGAFVETATRRMPCGLLVSGTDDGRYPRLHSLHAGLLE